MDISADSTAERKLTPMGSKSTSTNVEAVDIIQRRKLQSS